MRKIVIFVFYCVMTVSAHAQTSNLTTEVTEVRELLQTMIDSNLRNKDKFHTILTEASLEQQTPYATMLLCSDSRVDTGIVSDTPAGNIFVVRNIGNQLPTATGSIEYGVEHLHTHLLVIVGHSQCGAVKAAMQDYSKESKSIVAELDTLHVNPKQNLNYNLVKNVNNQVNFALKKFSKLVNKDELVIVGLIYDMHDDFKLGNGQIIFVNVNGETDPKLLAQNTYVKDLRDLVILQK